MVSFAFSSFVRLPRNHRTCDRLRIPSSQDHRSLNTTITIDPTLLLEGKDKEVTSTFPSLSQSPFPDPLFSCFSAITLVHSPQNSKSRKARAHHRYRLLLRLLLPLIPLTSNTRTAPKTFPKSLPPNPTNAAPNVVKAVFSGPWCRSTGYLVLG